MLFYFAPSVLSEPEHLSDNSSKICSLAVDEADNPHRQLCVQFVDVCSTLSYESRVIFEEPTQKQYQ